MYELYKSLRDNLDNLNNAIKQRYKVMTERAKAEYAYRSALGREMANAKSDGMAATALYQWAKGIDYIAQLRCERDIYASKEDYLSEYIIYLRAEIRIAEEQIKAEQKGM